MAHMFNYVVIFLKLNRHKEMMSADCNLGTQKHLMCFSIILIRLKLD